jgi:hypothetical protein
MVGAGRLKQLLFLKHGLSNFLKKRISPPQLFFGRLVFFFNVEMASLPYLLGLRSVLTRWIKIATGSLSI